jgi:hypothetical protein
LPVTLQTDIIGYNARDDRGDPRRSAMTHDDAARWLDRYVDAWRTYDPDTIGSLFADDVEYRYHRWDEPLRGRAAVVADWLADTDAPGTWEASYAPWAVEGNRFVGIGTSRYFEDGGDRLYHNVFLVELDGEGLATSFTEVWAKEP